MSDLEAQARAEYESEAIIRRIYKAVGADTDEAIVLDKDVKDVLTAALIALTRRVRAEALTPGDTCLCGREASEAVGDSLQDHELTCAVHLGASVRRR